jgi:WD40 repeat protein
VRIWDVNTGAVVGGVLQHEGVVWRVGLSPDRQRLVAKLKTSAMRLKPGMETDPHRRFIEDIQIWDLATCQPVPGLSYESPFASGSNANIIEFSRDGKLLLLAGDSAGPTIWDTATLKALEGYHRPHHTDHVLFACFSPDGQRILTTSEDCTARISDARTGQSLAPPLRHYSEVKCGRFSDDGQWVATLSKDAMVKIWDAWTGELVTEPIQGDYATESLYFSPNRQNLLLPVGRTLQIWDCRCGASLSSRIDGALLEFHPAEEQALMRVTVDKKNWNLGCKLQVWDLSSMKPQTELLDSKTDNFLDDAQFSPDGRLIRMFAKGRLHTWDARTGAPVGAPVSIAHESAKISSDGSRIFAASHEEIECYDAHTGHLLSSTPQPKGDKFTVVAISPAADLALLSNERFNFTLRIWDAVTGQIGVEPYEPYLEDGGSLSRYLCFPSGELLPTPFAYDGLGTFRSAVFSPDGQKLVTVQDDNTALIWQALTGRVLVKLTGHLSTVRAVRLSPDGSIVATASYDHTVRIWDVITGKPMTEPLQHTGRVTSVEFSRNGAQIIAVSDDGTVRIWDSDSGLAVTEALTDDTVREMAQLSPNGRWVFTGFCFWEIPPATLSVPDWLPELAEAVAGKRINDAGITEMVPADMILEYRRLLRKSSSPDIYDRWAHWFFADRMTRTISPSCRITVTEHVQGLIQQDTLESLRAAVRLAPDHGLAYARLAAQVLHRNYTGDPRGIGEADFLSQYALHLSPDDPQIQRLRGEIVEQIQPQSKTQ